MSEKIRVIQYGLGPIGKAVARHISERPHLELVGAVDIDPSMVGRDAGEVIDLGRELGFGVHEKLAHVLAGTDGDVVTHTTSSYFDLFQCQIVEILNEGLSVVSTAEEMAFPWLVHAGEAQAIDAAAKKAGKVVLATGVNPGFVMDTLPLMLTGICQQVNRIDITRAIDASTRRGPFQAKIGSGQTVEAFEAKMQAGRMGHVGLPESMGMIFDTLGKDLVAYETNVEAVVAEHRVETTHYVVEPGEVMGVKQVAKGIAADGEFVTFTFVAALEVDRDGDIIQITGHPNLEVRLQGTNGDIATVAIVANAIARVMEAPPGLVTMRDLPIVTVGYHR